MKGTKKKAPAVQKKQSFGVYMKRYWQLYALLALPLLYLLIFKYVPMIYIQIAFKKYSIVQSVWEMPLAANHGFEYFIKAFKNRDFINALRNTLTLNLLDLVIGFPAPIIFALILNELVFKKFKRVVQTIAYMPHFLSWVIIYGLALQIFAPTTGFLNMILTGLGFESVPFLNDSAHWVGTYIFLGVWQSFGWNSIVYLAAIAGINSELYEAYKENTLFYNPQEGGGKAGRKDKPEFVPVPVGLHGFEPALKGAALAIRRRHAPLGGVNIKDKVLRPAG